MANGDCEEGISIDSEKLFQFSKVIFSVSGCSLCSHETCSEIREESGLYIPMSKIAGYSLQVPYLLPTFGLTCNVFLPIVLA